MSKIWLRAISSFEVIGGIWGVLSIISEIIEPEGNLYIIGLIVNISIFVLSLIAGVTLWQEYPIGRTLSIIVQTIQLPKILSPVVVFSFSFGADLFIIWISSANIAHLRFHFELGGNNQFMFGVLGAPFGIGVSITSCLMLAVLLRTSLMKKSVDVAPSHEPAE